MNSITPSPSTPPCAPTASGENLFIPFMIFYIYIYICYADRVERSLKYKYHLLLVLLFTDAGLGSTLGGKLALRAGGRRQCISKEHSRLLVKIPQMHLVHPIVLCPARADLRCFGHILRSMLKRGRCKVMVRNVSESSSNMITRVMQN